MRFIIPKKSSIRIIISYFFILGVSYSSTNMDTLTVVQDYIKHADTYYWLSRARGGNVTDIQKNIIYLNKAQNLLKNRKNPSDKKLLLQVVSALTEAKAQIENSKGELNNYSPLIPLLLGQETVIEYFDDAFDIALEKSVNSLIENNKPAFKTDFQLFLVPISHIDENRSGVEEIVHHYINNNTSLYALSRHELVNILTLKEVENLYNSEIDTEILNKISNAIPSKGIGMLTITMVDTVNNLNYASSQFKFWNVEKQKFEKQSSAYEFSEYPKGRAYLLLLLLLLGFPFVYMFNKINEYLKSEGSFSPVWLGTLTAVLSMCISVLFFRGISLLDIDGGTLIGSPVGLGWIAVIVLIISILPLFLVYMGSARIKTIGVVLNNPETISTLVLGTFLGSFTLLAMVATVRLGMENALIVTIPAILSAGVPAFFIGKSYSKSVMTGDQVSFIKYTVLLMGLMVYAAFILTWDIQLTMYSTIGLLVFTVMIESVPYLVKKLSGDSGIKIEKGIRFNHENAKWEVIEPGDQKSMALLMDSNEEQKKIDNEIILKNIIKEEEQSGIGWLRREIKEPKFFNTIGPENFEQIINFVEDGLADNSPQIEVVFIEAEIGMGKTRLAKELAEGIKDRFGKDKKFKTTILFGDCDDPQYDADLVPYEPFAQALSELLNVNRFSNPAKKAEELRSSPTGQVLGNLISGGLGPLGVLLDAEDEGQPQKADTKEIAKTIAEVLTQLSEDNGKIVFIIDDTQWMDDDSFELLGLIIDILSNDTNFKDKNKVSFIFTSRPKDDDKIKGFLVEKEKEDVVNVNRDVNHELFQKEPKIVDGLLENLKFDFRSKQALVNYFNDLGIRSPLQILQTLDTAVEKKMIEYYADKFILAKGADLKKLPKPDDYNRMVEELLNGLDPRLLDMLQCAAVLGRSFKASIISEIFKVDMLDFLDMVKGAEERNLLKDVSEKDDIYEFVQKRMVGIFRNLRTHGDDEFIPQMVREYHKRYVEIKEKEFERNNIPQNEIPYRDLLSMATHSKAIADVYPEKALVYNKLAAEQAYERGLFSIANKFFNNCLDILSKYETQINVNNYLELFIVYAKCLLDEQDNLNKVASCIAKAHEIIDQSSPDTDKDQAKIELKLIEALKLYRDRNFHNARKIAKEIIDHDATGVQKLRAKFYFAISIELDKVKERKEKHLEVIEEAKRLSQNNLKLVEKIEVWKVLSEVFNNTGFVFLNGLKKPEDAKEYFLNAIKINKKPEVNDQKGIGIANGGLGDCHYALKDYGQAENHYTINLNISRNNGDKQGIVRMTSMLGGIKLLNAKNEQDADIKENLLYEAKDYYNDSLMVAEDQKSIFSIMFALKGLFQCVIHLDKKFKDNCKTLFKKLNEQLKQYESLKNTILKLEEKQKNQVEELEEQESKELNDSNIEFSQYSKALLILSKLPPQYDEDDGMFETIEEKTDDQFKKEIENYYNIIKQPES